jgi:hypothetical protein
MEFQGDSSTEPSSGYALEEVRAAAREAGIADEFMDAALADVRLERVAPSRSCNSASVVVEPLDVRCRRADRMTGRTEKISGSTITSRRKEPWVSTRKPLPI